MRSGLQNIGRAQLFGYPPAEVVESGGNSWALECPLFGSIIIIIVKTCGLFVNANPNPPPPPLDKHKQKR